MNAVSSEPLSKKAEVADASPATPPSMLSLGSQTAPNSPRPDAVATGHTSLERLTAILTRALGVQPYDPRWERQQRDYQNKIVAEQLVQGSWVSVLVMGFATFMSGIGDLTWVMHFGLIVQALAFFFGFAFMPGSPICIARYSDPKSGTYTSAVTMLGVGVGWACFAYTAMVYLPEEWHGLAIGAVVSTVAMGGIYSSAYPLISLGFMVIVATGATLGIVESERPLGAYYHGAWLLEVLVLYMQFLNRSRDALNHVRDAAQLEASEAQRRKAIESQHAAERKLNQAREEERLRTEDRRVEKDAARKQELFALAAQFETTISEVVTSVATSARQFSLTAKVMSQQATEAFDQIEQIAEAMEQVAQGATAAAAASDEFAISIDNVSGQAATAAQLAHVTHDTAMATDETVRLLNQRAEGIGEIVQLINTIAGRTRLLAVNASIEAARGGEAGRGFGVVASEVKDLASQTSHATGDVSSKIAEMQSRTKTSAKELADIREQIGILETSATSIATAMDQQTHAGKSLAESIDMAATGAGEVSIATQELRKAASAVGGASERLSQASDSLEDQAEMMKTKVADFLAQIRRD